MSQRIYFWLTLAQDGALAITATIMLFNLGITDVSWWLAAGLLIGLGFLYHHWPTNSYHLYLAAEIVLVAGLLALDPIAVIQCFTFSAHATILFPNRVGAAWIGLLTVVAGAAFVYHDGWLSGLLSTLAYGAGYGSFGFAQYARELAYEAQKRSEALYADLKEAHHQLQAYAEHVEEFAVAEERNRLAREMHDTLGHRLTVAAVQLEGAQRLIPTDPERAARMVGVVRDQVREGLSELRRTVATLRTPLEADLSLSQSLARLAADFEAGTGIVVHLDLPDHPPALPDTHRLALYRATQEGLTNVQRHARAGSVWLRLSVLDRDRAVTLVVEDDGVGFPADAEQVGLGLRGMQERALQLGGALALGSSPWGGARITLRLPLSWEDGENA